MKRDFKTAHFLLYALFFLHLFFGFCAFSQSRAIATNVNASAKSENEILLTWDLSVSEGVTSIMIYRKNTPIVFSQDLDSLKEIAQVAPQARSFTDVIEDKTAEYFYAVIASVSGKIYGVVIPSVNATVIACTLPEAQKQQTLIEKTQEEEKRYFLGSLREQPLPYMKKSLSDSKQSGTESKKASQAVENMFPLMPKNATESLSPYVFSKDKEKNATGDDFILQIILKRTFFNADYKKASEELVKFLSANRDENATKRAQFYLGECYYFSGDYKTALQYFLKTQNDFVPLCRKWSRYTLNAYEIPN